MLFYDKIYKKNKIEEGKVSPMVKEIPEFLFKNCKCLDLGCGQGKETFYLANLNCKVMAVDSSSVAIKQIKTKVKEEGYKNIKAKKMNIKDCTTKDKNNYNIILCLNVLNFLEKKDVYKTIKNIKKLLKKDGIIIISAFNKRDPANKSKKTNLKYFFKKNELLKLFKRFKVLHYSENLIKDLGHPGAEKPHLHGLSQIIIKKESK